MKAPIICLVLAALAAGCAPKRTQSPVRATLDAQAALPRSPELASRALGAQAKLERWPTDSAVELSLLVEEARRELEIAAAAGHIEDIRFERAVQAFESATTIITAAADPLDADDVDAVSDLLRFSRSGALAARDEPTAVSPTNSLKTLRKHQQAPGHYEY